MRIFKFFLALLALALSSFPLSANQELKQAIKNYLTKERKLKFIRKKDEKLFEALRKQTIKRYPVEKGTLLDLQLNYCLYSKAYRPDNARIQKPFIREKELNYYRIKKILRDMSEKNLNTPLIFHQDLLLMALENLSFRITNLLLSYGAYLFPEHYLKKSDHLKNISFRTYLQALQSNLSPSFAQKIQHRKIMSLFLDYNVDLNSGPLFEKPIHLAVQIHQDSFYLKKLLENNVDISVRNIYGETASDLLIQKIHVDPKNKDIYSEYYSMLEKYKRKKS